MGKQPEKSPARKADPRTLDDDDPLVEELARRLNSIVPGPQRSQVVAQVISLVQEERFSGPICHPKHLREYEEALPGSADRIVSMAESALTHSRSMQELALKADIADMREGRRLGFAGLVLLIGGAILCGALGQVTIALALLGTSAIGALGTLIRGRGRLKSG